MEKNKSIATNAILNTTKTVLGIIFPLITYPYVSRVLGVVNLGIYNFSLSFLSYFLLIAALGVSTYGIREGTQYRDNKIAISKFVSELFSINMISAAFSYLLLCISLFNIPFMENYRVPVLILSAEIICSTIGVSWVCNIYEDFFIIAVRTIFFQIVSLVLLFMFIKTSNDLYKYLIILVISNSGANLFNFLYVRKKFFKFTFTLMIDWKRHLKPILIIFFTSITITIYVSSDTLMLGVLLDNYQVGLYSTAVKVYTIVKNILASIVMVLIPHFSLMLNSSVYKDTNIFFTKVFNVLSLLMLPLCIIIFSLSEDIVLIVSGESFLGAAKPLKLLCLAVVFSLYSYLYTQCILIPMKKENIVFKVTVFSAIVNCLLNLILIPKWGISGAAVTTIIAEIIVFLMSYYFTKNEVRLVNLKHNYISVLCGCIGVYVLCLFTSNIFNNLLLRCGFTIIGSLLVYLFVLHLLRNEILKFVLRTILKIGSHK